MNGNKAQLTLPASAVAEVAGADGRPVFALTLPALTTLHGQDLSGKVVLAREAWEDERLADTWHLVLDEGAVVVHDRLAPDTRTGGAQTRGVACVGMSVETSSLVRAVHRAQTRERCERALEQARRLLDAGELTGARDVLSFALEGHDPLPTVRSAGEDEHVPASASALEAASILGAWMPTCTAPLHSPSATLDSRYAYVAFDPRHCVSAATFSALLEDARSRPASSCGALEEHAMVHVVRALAEAFGCRHARTVALVNGVAHDVTRDVLLVEGVLREGAVPEVEPAQTELGPVTLTFDTHALVERYHLTPREADVLCRWLCERVSCDVAVGLNVAHVGHLDCLLRSPEAVRVALASGVVLENPATGERMALDPITGRVASTRAHGPHAGGASADAPGMLDWCLVRVASDGRWRVSDADAERIARDDCVLRRMAEAWRGDCWLTDRGRREHVSHARLTDLRLAVRPTPPPPARAGASGGRHLADEIGHAHTTAKTREDAHA